MKVLRFDGHVPMHLVDQAVDIAVICAKDLTGFHLEARDPFLPMIQAEVCTRAIEDFKLQNNPEQIPGGTSKSGSIFVVDGDDEDAPVVGFTTYKPRLPDFTCASVGYMAVLPNHRGRGVFRSMMGEMISQYDVIALDCPISLIPLYEKFGFHVTGPQSGHIAMANGQVTGKMWHLGTEEIMGYPMVKTARHQVFDSLGAKRDKALKRFNDQNKEAVQRAKRVSDIHLAQQKKKPPQ